MQSKYRQYLNPLSGLNNRHLVPIFGEANQRGIKLLSSDEREYRDQGLDHGIPFGPAVGLGERRPAGRENVCQRGTQK